MDHYRIKGTDSCMSVSNQAYLGFNRWWGATGFTRGGSHQISQYNRIALSFYSQENAYLHCWNAYTVLDVAFQS